MFMSLICYHCTDTSTVDIDTATIASVVPKKEANKLLIFFVLLKPSADVRKDLS